MNLHFLMQLQLVRSFMKCNFTDYTDMILSEKARSFVFRNPSNYFSMKYGTLSKQALYKAGILKQMERVCHQTKIRWVYVISLKRQSNYNTNIV